MELQPPAVGGLAGAIVSAAALSVREALAGFDTRALGPAEAVVTAQCRLEYSTIAGAVCFGLVVGVLIVPCGRAVRVFQRAAAAGLEAAVLSTVVAARPVPARPRQLPVVYHDAK